MKLAVSLIEKKQYKYDTKKDSLYHFLLLNNFRKPIAALRGKRSIKISPFHQSHKAILAQLQIKCQT
jgi:hypothetical protein